MGKEIDLVSGLQLLEQMQFACGAVYANKGMDGRDRKEPNEKSLQVRNVTRGAEPGGEWIKRKVIDIHFNPQLTTCHPIFTHETRKRSYLFFVPGRQ